MTLIAAPPSSLEWSAESADDFLSRPIPPRSAWVRLIISIRRLDEARRLVEDCRLSAVTRDGDEVPLETIAWDGWLLDDLYLPLPKGCREVRIRPVDGAARLRVETLEARPLGRAASATQALRHKWKLLRAYRNLRPVMMRGLRDVSLLRFGTVGRKLFNGLTDARLMRPENDEAAKAARRRSPQRLTPAERHAAAKALDAMIDPPPISVVWTALPYSPEQLRRVVDSVRRQVYPHWTLCVGRVDVLQPAQRIMLERFALADSRIRLADGEKNSGVAGAFNAALALSPCDLVAVLNPGHELTELALLKLAQAVAEQPDAEAVLNRHPSAHSDDAAEAFRVTGHGQQLHLLRAGSIHAAGGCPRFDRDDKPLPGPAVVKRLDLAGAIYLPDQLTRSGASLDPIRLPPPEGFVEPVEVTPPTSRCVTVAGDILGISGWDYVVYEIARGLFGLGADMKLSAFSGHRLDLLPPALAARRRLPAEGDVMLNIMPPHLLEHHRPAPGGVIFTMWECEKLPPKAVSYLNAAKLVIVPSKWNRENFVRDGVTTPIEIVPLGHDPLRFHDDGSFPEVCTFGTAGAMWGGGTRKNVASVIDWFREAFPDEVDVRLRVKITPKCDLPETDDPRIEILRGYLTPADLAEWYRSLTCYVNASSAEGFGLHLIEAMACGRGVMSAPFSALTEYFDSGVGWELGYVLEQAKGDVYRGLWSRARPACAVAAMRAVYADREAARRKGEASAARAREFAWKGAGKKLLGLLRGV